MQQRLANRTPFYYGWVVLVAAGSAMFVRNAAASLTIAVFVYPLSEELGWSRTLISGAAAAGGLAATFMSPLVGRLIDRYGARTVLTVSILLLCASTMLLRWSDIALVTPSVAISWWVIDLKVPSLIIPLVFYIGYATGRVIFSSPVQIGAAVVVSRWFIRLRGRTNGILNMSHSVGMVLFPLIASIIIVQSGWRDAWFVLSVLVFVAALLPVAILISERPEDLGLRPDGDLEDDSAGDEDSVAQSDVAEEPEWTAEEAKRTATLWLIALATGLLFLMQAGTNTHSAAFFQDQGLGAVIAGFGISFNAIFLGVGSVVWGVVVEKVPVRFVMAAVALVMAAASFLFTTTNTAVEALAYSAIFGFGLGGMLTVPPVAYADYYGRRSLGTIRGITEPFTTFGQAVGVMIPGIVFDYISSESYMPFFYAAGSVGILTAIISLFATQPHHSPTGGASAETPSAKQS